MQRGQRYIKGRCYNLRNALAWFPPRLEECHAEAEAEIARTVEAADGSRMTARLHMTLDIIDYAKTSEQQRVEREAQAMAAGPALVAAARDVISFLEEQADGDKASHFHKLAQKLRRAMPVTEPHA